MCGENKECSCCKQFLLKDSFEFSKRFTTDEGYLMADVILARTGIQEYRAFELGIKSDDPNKIYKVYRPEEEVFDSESMKSFAGKPVTNNHPPELISIDNVKIYQVGYTGTEVFRKDNLLMSKIIITDKYSISDVGNGKTQVSNGYTSDFDFTAGVTDNGESYDLIQRNIRGNHVAIVNNGRCGETCKIQDSGEKMSIELVSVKIGDAEYSMPEDAKNAVQSLADEVVELKSKLSEKEIMIADGMEKMETMKGKLDALETKDQSIGEDMKYTDEDVEKLAEERMRVSDVARKAAPSFDCAGKTVLDIKKAVISAKRPNLVMDSKSDDYVTACYDVIAEEVERGNTSEMKIPVTVNDENFVSERDKMINREFKGVK